MVALKSCLLIVGALCVYGQIDEQEWQCPQFWVYFQSSCYRFIKSPLRSRNEARRNCQAYEADLLSVSTIEEHAFILYQLSIQDPQHRRWYISAHQQSPNYWVNEDGTSLSEFDQTYFSQPTDSIQQNGDYLIYNFSNLMKRWVLERVSGDELLLYICEASVAKVHYLVMDDRTSQYGLNVDDPERLPKGPYFIKQPVNVVYDLSERQIYNDVTLSCLAGGFPTPTYEWFKEDYELNTLVATRIDPLKDKRYTLSGGSLIIHNPRQIEDGGFYHCKASNEYGTIVSETVELSFGVMGDFNLKRSPESGNENWGKAIFCDPPQFYPAVKYYWARERFPVFVEEDKRVFVSYDGALYFSALEHIDQGNYSCNVQSVVSFNGRNGPFFPLYVKPHSNYQQLKFPNNFPKAFPEAPVAGKDVRLECVAFGYPVPSYNWTRRGTPLPRSAKSSSFNRVLTISNVQVEDQGEYLCRATNGRAAIENSVSLSIQAEPNFTIPLTDKHMDNGADLTWTCEAFGIPDVTYHWYRNGIPIEIDKLPPEDSGRYIVQDNVLTIRYLNPERDPAMYQCQAKNILATKYSSAQLRVLSLSPDFKKRPLEPETYAGEGGNVTIVCSPEAAPRPKFTWKKDNNIIGSGGRRKILEIGNLIISPVSRDDEGLYTCQAQNKYGSDTSHGRLIVLKGPSLTSELPPKMVTSVGKDVYMNCRAVSEEILDYAFIWSHNGIKLNPTEDTHHKRKISGGSLEIHNVTFADAGEYECRVKSTVSEITTKTTLVVDGPPGPPGGVQVTGITKTSAIIQWTDGAKHGREITHYSISGRTQWNQTWFIIVSDVIGKEVDRYNGRKGAAINDGLTPYCTYEFRVQAGNELGLGLPSLPSPRYRTLSDKPYKAPDNIGGGGGKIGDLIITWKAANEEGYGPESNITIIYSAEDMPQVAPQLVSARSFNSTAVNVSWTAIDQTREKVRGKLIGHRLKYWKKDNKEEDAVYYLSRSTRPWSLIVGLQPDTYYFVKVMAYNSAGEGPESERYLEKTYRKAPQKPPSSVNVFGIDPSTVRVVWRYVQPSSEEEPLQGYKIRVWEVDQDMSTANDTIIERGSTLEAYVTNLSPGKTYHLRVLAFSNGGDGRMSSPAFTFQMGDAQEFRSSSNALLPSSLAVVSLIFFYERLL
ncbi:contactin isoform X2 [Rhodnius prolixus]|uniref:contactin isoform X2 n=1 Tax=Rhodnius prolixus TaxID=13249 RepID=UPI003D18F967